MGARATKSGDRAANATMELKAHQVAADESENREPATGQKPELISSSRLTTCEVIENGKAVRLDFLDNAGKQVSVAFPFEQAESVVMTLPRMLAMALQLRTRSQEARYVFPLARWSIESGDENFLIANLMTNDGFAVSFAVPFDACRAIGWTLCREGQSGPEDDAGSPGKPAAVN
jgi:hypothetical protein